MGCGGSKANKGLTVKNNLVEVPGRITSYSPEYDYLFKVLMLGDSGVGKTSLLLRYVEGSFENTMINTIGVDFKNLIIKLDGKVIKEQVWDTESKFKKAGQERFRNITSSYYRGSMGIILVFSLANKRSFISLKSWINDVEKEVGSAVDMILVGNKSDLDREVQKEEAMAFAKELKIDYIECSAKSNTLVEKPFLDIAARIKKNRIDAKQATA